ncbi:MAG: polyribonucleotide nucleotidyltransferase, partial [Candidatus Omnitrophica bacterium]|nr:polyribonucleotide nucleotidyltransferase [Candidatus Omnitrophota bacterium]
EILTARMIDRPIRPLFPEGMLNETQVVATVLSIDDKSDPDILALIGASAALTISNIPFDGPLGAVRVGIIDDQFVLNPTFEEREKSGLDLVIVANEEDVVMLEAGADQISEERMTEAIKFGHEGLKPLIEAQKRFREAVGKPKREDISRVEVDLELYNKIREKVTDRFNRILLMSDKQQRMEALDLLRGELIEQEIKGGNESPEQAVKAALGKLEKEIVRDIILKGGKRVDGREFGQIRKLESDVNLLPRTHGSALFTRGETQALAVTTLGTGSDEQIIDALEGESKRTFMLHYNFPPFSVGEARPMRGPGRREIGHGALAAKALKPVLPSSEEFPYTIRLVSEILESNGSSSMATVCASSMSLMGGGVPVKAAVGGIAMGLLKDGDNYVILTDIAGVEDHYGDMDFKVAGTVDGITAVQMDMKVKGVRYDILVDGFEKARKARLEVLEHMSHAIAQPAAEIAETAPRIVSLKVKVDKIREIIGPGGKMIRKIIAETGADINVEDDGTCQVSSPDKASLENAVQMIQDIIVEPEVGRVYEGRITKLMNFGAFCEFMPGREGLIHVSEISSDYVKDASEHLAEGDEVKVVLFEIDSQGRNNLSIKRVKDLEEKG